MLKLFACLTFLVISDSVLGNLEYTFNVNSNSWYKLHQVPATWQEAFRTCNDEGALLASPLNTDIMTYLTINMLFHKVDRPIHLGVNALHSEGVFVSLEGVQLDNMLVTWGSYGDGKKPGDCLTLAPDGKVFMSSCSQYLPYFCYKHGHQETPLNECADSSYRFNPKTLSCYKLHKEEKKWSEAYKTCLAEGGHLVVLNDRREVEAIMELIPPEDAAEKDAAEDDKSNWHPITHVGLLDWNKDFTWITVNGQKIENVYNKWKPGHPDKKGDNMCVALLRDGTLENFNCSVNEIMFICEKYTKEIY